MRKLSFRPIAFTAAMALLLSACDDTMAPAPHAPPDAGRAISDAAHGDIEDQNPGFWWLPPMVDQTTLSGSFQSAFSPTVKVILCRKSLDQTVTCDPGKTAVESPQTPGLLAEFGSGSGLTVEADHFKVELDTDAFGLEPTVSGDTTVYRILTFTDALPDFGGPFVMGYADFQLAETGKEVKNLSGADTTTIALVDGRTLPIKFYVNERAYPHELTSNSAATEAAGIGTLCEINCSVTVVSTADTTEASLFDDAGVERTAILFEPGDVGTTSVLVIDERIEEGEGANCAVGVNLEKKNCFRYEITPSVPFNNPVRMGICPVDVPKGQGVWRILQVDDGAINRPPEVDVGDFLSCPTSTAFLHRVLNWIIRPLYAEDFDGAQLQGTSDLFWSLDAEASSTASADTAEAGSTLTRTVTIVGTHPEPDVPLEGEPVDFLVTLGAGSLAAPAGVTPVSTTLADDGTTVIGMRLLTDANGDATVDWTVASGDNTLTADTPEAEGGPITFHVTGTAAAVLVGTETQITTDPALQFSPDVSGDRIVWEDNRNSSLDFYVPEDIFLHDTATGIETLLTTGGADSSGYAGRPAISGTWIVWQQRPEPQGGDYDIFLYDLTTGSSTLITWNSVHDMNPDISGNRVVYQTRVEGEGWWAVYLQEMHSLTSSTVTLLTPKRTHAFGVASYVHPRISGDRVVWQDSRHDNDWEIYTLDLSTGIETRITSNPANQSQPAVSGDRIVWVDERNGDADIYLYDFATGVEQPIATGSAYQGDPDISGDLIVWTELDPSGSAPSQVYVHDLASGSTAQVSSSTVSGSGARVPAVSGNRVVWADRPDGNMDIFTAPVSSGGATANK